MGSFPLPLELSGEAPRVALPPGVVRASSLGAAHPLSLEGPGGLELPRGAVVEIASPAGLGGARFALAACAAARARAGEAWCAWIDTTRTLHAPGVVRAGVDPARMLIVRPPPAELGRVAVRVVQSRLFAVVVIDRCGIPGAEIERARTRPALLARRLALAAEGSPSTVLLLSSTAQVAAEPLPVALRLQIDRAATGLTVRIARDRAGRTGGSFQLSA